LKPHAIAAAASASVLLSEQHPREQGLKQILTDFISETFGVFQSNIQENKD